MRRRGDDAKVRASHHLAERQLPKCSCAGAAVLPQRPQEAGPPRGPTIGWAPFARETIEARRIVFMRNALMTFRAQSVECHRALPLPLAWGGHDEDVRQPRNHRNTDASQTPQHRGPSLWKRHCYELSIQRRSPTALSEPGLARLPPRARRACLPQHDSPIGRSAGIWQDFALCAPQRYCPCLSLLCPALGVSPSTSQTSLSAPAERRLTSCCSPLIARPPLASRLVGRAPTQSMTQAMLAPPSVVIPLSFPWLLMRPTQDQARLPRNVLCDVRGAGPGARDRPGPERKLWSQATTRNTHNPPRKDDGACGDPIKVLEPHIATINSINLSTKNNECRETEHGRYPG